MDANPRAELQELLRRLMQREYRDSDIREAAAVLCDLQTHAETAGLGEELLSSPFAQIRALGVYMLEAIAGRSPRARQALERPEAAALRQGQAAETPARERRLGHEAMADIIRMWIREDSKRPPKKPEDWLPRA